MALLKVFAVFDSKLAAHFHPFYAVHAAIAKRSFHAIANDPSSQICQHPADFTLLELAEWNDETGEFNNYPKPINHGTAAIYKVRSLDYGEVPSEQKRDAAPVLAGAKGGDSAKHV